MATLQFKTPARALRLFAATVLFGMAGAFIHTAHAAPGGHGGMAGPGHMARLLDRAGASAEQKAQITILMEAARNDLKPVMAQMKTLHAQSAALFTQPAVDANAAEVLRQQMQALQAQVSKRMLQAKVESSRVLTPEQRTKMADMMKKRRAMAERHRAEAESLIGKPPRVK